MRMTNVTLKKITAALKKITTRDILAISFLVFGGVVAIAIARDHDGFSLKGWQTITASFIALGAAWLAYIGVMAKLKYDERTAKELDRRRTLGMYLRMYFAVGVLHYEAREALETTVAAPENESENETIEVNNISLSDLPEIREAWANLDSIPPSVLSNFYLVQDELYNFATFKKDHAGQSYNFEFGKPIPRQPNLIVVP
jgi:hypothetical protein